MRLKLIGINHKTAPINIREQVTIPEDLLPEANRLFNESVDAEETMLLSTCNRVEAYLYGPVGNETEEATVRFLRDFSEASLQDLNQYIYTLSDEDAVEHLLRVASGLDSMVIGEAQITGQLKNAYSIARQGRTSAKELNRLMSYAFFTAKKVRSETRISEQSVSISSVAVELARKIFEDLTKRQVLLIGAGKMSRLAARGFLSSGVKGLCVVNRTYEKACRMSRELGGEACSYDKLEEKLVSSDIVIVSTGAREYILDPEIMERVIRHRKNQPLFIIDITVPRNADPRINEIDNIFLYDIDDLEAVIKDHMKNRLSEATQAEQIIREEVKGFMDLRRQRDFGPLVKALRDKVEEICREELEASRKSISAAEYEQIKKVMFRTINRLSHPLIRQVKSSAEDYPELLNNQEFLKDLVREAFELKEKK
jgi:glutamyl-tRNA reductase